MTDIPDREIVEALKRERRQDRVVARAFARACLCGDVSEFCEYVDALNDLTIDGWRHAFKAVAKGRRPNSQIQKMFLRVWIESKSIQRRVGDDRVCLDALRLLCPRYQGASVRLFRGDSFENRCHRTYGIAWSADRDTAMRFAREPWHNGRKGGSVLLETLAPREAIISSTHLIGDHYGEQEYLLDRRRLKSVKVIDRYQTETR
jgi:hypothetical protein